MPTNYEVLQPMTNLTWTCPKCGRQCSYVFKDCAKCGTVRAPQEEP